MHLHAGTTPKPKPAGAPAFDALKLSDVKDQLGIRQGDLTQDTKLNLKIQAAHKILLDDAGMAGGAQDFMWTPGFLQARNALPFLNVLDVSVVSYWDGDQYQAVDPAGWQFIDSLVRPELARIPLNEAWPQPAEGYPVPWQISFQAGFVDEDSVDPDYTQAGLALVSQLWAQDKDQLPLGDIYEALQGRFYSTYI